MSFSQMFLLYFIALAVFAVLDLLWVWVVSRRLYHSALEGTLRARFNFISTAVFYLLYVVGLMIFVIVPASNPPNLGQAMGLGILYGLFTFGTFSLLNMSMLREWSLLIVLVDLIRGMLVTGIVSTAAFYISQVIS
jgi:uncharacterized membrane protein